MPKALRLTNPWISTKKGLVPSRIGTTTEPEESSGPLTKKNLGRVQHFLQTRSRHLKNTDLIGGTKTVLVGPKHAIRRITFAFKIKHGINHMFQDPWACQHAFLGDMPDEKKSKTPRDLASWVKTAALSLTWATEPGDEDISAKCTTWIESMITTCGLIHGYSRNRLHIDLIDDKKILIGVWAPCPRASWLA
jgi:hypothetical protein